MNRDSKRLEFESLVLPLLDFLLGLAMQLTHDKDRAEDLVQETVLKAYRSFSRFRTGSNFRAWTARILTNTFLTDTTRAKRWADDVDLDAFPAPDPASLPTAVTRLEDIPRDAFGDEVMNALHELPGGMAVAVYLADVAELSYDEIAEALQAPIGTVRSRISRGRQHLQARLVDFARASGLEGRKSS